MTTENESPSAAGARALGENSEGSEHSQDSRCNGQRQVQNRAEAERFLALIDPDTESFTFQLIDEQKRGDTARARVLHGSLDQHWEKLVSLNAEGVGVFVVVNETNLQGRKAENVTRVRALFVDLDGAPLEPILQAKPEPHIVVESSPERYHVYWCVLGIPLNAFADMQKALAARFDGDPAVSDLPRVMRLPGFSHCKREPFLSRIIHTSERDEPYTTIGELAVLIPDTKANGKTHFEEYPSNQQSYDTPPLWEVKAALDAYPNTDKIDRVQWVKVGHSVKSAYPGEDGFEVFDEWSKRWTGKYDEQKTRKAWDSFKPRDVTIGTLFHLATEATPGWRARSQYGAEGSTTIKSKLMQSSAEFVGNYVPPDYLVDGLLQRRYVYSFTGPTGSGKTAIVLRFAAHVALGLPLGGKQVERGRVLFFAGENPDDVRSRWVALCEQMNIDPDAMDVVFMPFTPNLSNTEVRGQIDTEAAVYGAFSLLIVDTSAAYYSGNDENDNVQLGKHARLMRTFVDLPGGPTVLVTCHPTKSADMNNLLPRGAGAFLAEMDGNLVCIKSQGSMLAEVTTHGKFRGPEFSPFSFKLVSTTSERLVDTKGRRTWTVFAEPLTDQEQAAIEREGHSHQDAVLRVMLDWSDGSPSMSQIAGRLFRVGNDGTPNKAKVHRLMQKLAKHKLVEQKRDGTYALTEKGKKEAENTGPVDTLGG
jgi:hypothetical protein